ncbi:hypothetical protein SBA7_1050009 [Candidatus Sulfotelmatobacter sp. SbA7]|nr:hypothetical protein SBA7_1050009 [Candidatus Sulfotelmatobacter sp. SbA7]
MASPDRMVLLLQPPDSARVTAGARRASGGGEGLTRANTM